MSVSNTEPINAIIIIIIIIIISNELDEMALSHYCCRTTLQLHFNFILLYTLCSKKSDAKIQITITTAYLIRIKYLLSGFNYHLSDVNVANFNIIHCTVSEQQLF